MYLLDRVAYVSNFRMQFVKSISWNSEQWRKVSNAFSYEEENFESIKFTSVCDRIRCSEMILLTCTAVFLGSCRLWQNNFDCWKGLNIILPPYSWGFHPIHLRHVLRIEPFVPSMTFEYSWCHDFVNSLQSSIYSLLPKFDYSWLLYDVQKFVCFRFLRSPCFFALRTSKREMTASLCRQFT